MKVLGFDTETTGLDPKTAHIIEMGAVLYDVSDEGHWDYSKDFNQLIFQDEYFPLPPEAAEAMKINGIKEDDIKRHGISFRVATDILHGFGDIDFIVAHNAEYDKAMFAADCVFNKVHSKLLDVPWVCSSRDISYVEKYRVSGLSKIALGQGITVDPTKLHRAVADVQLMGQVLSATKADPRKMLETKKIPTLVIATQTRKPWEDDGKSNAVAKEQGYRWESAVYKTYPKQWVKAVKADKISEEKLPYTIIEEIHNGW